MSTHRANVLIFTLTSIVSCFTITNGYLTHQISMGMLFHTDSLYLSALFSDIQRNFSNFASWNLPQAPYFFPDMLLFFGLKALIGDTYKTFYAFAIIQNLLALLLASAIASTTTKNWKSLAFLSTVFLVVITFYTTQNKTPFILLLLSGHHFGNVINGLLLL